MLRRARALVAALVVAALVVAVAGCRTARGIVNQAEAERDPPTRGDVAGRRGLTRDDELAIATVIVTRFFRPSGGQARWLDPRPLGDVRDSTADAAVEPDEVWADAMRDAAGDVRVCVYDPDVADECRGRNGGVLRFSHPYAEGDDHARVFVHWTPARDDGGALPALGQPRFEMLFTMERRGAGWGILAQRAVNP